MSTTINSYGVSLTMDADRYIEKSRLSRKETMALTRQINSTRTPAERYERSIKSLDKALAKGGISQETYNRLVADAGKKLDKTQKSVDKNKKSVDGLGASVKKMAAAYVGVQTLRFAFTSLREEMLRVDQTAKLARGMGESVFQLERFKFAASEIAGVAGTESSAMLAKLSKRVGEAAIGSGEAAQTFNRLGVSIKRLTQSSPVEQFRLVSKAFASMGNESMQAAEANKLFEESGVKIIPLLKSTAEEFEKSAINAEKFGLAINSLQASKIEAANDAVGRLSASAGNLWRVLATELGDSDVVPAMDAFSDSIQASLVGMRGLLAVSKDMVMLVGGRKTGFEFFNELRGNEKDKAAGFGDFGFGPQPGRFSKFESSEGMRSPEISASVTNAIGEGVRDGLAGAGGGLMAGFDMLASIVDNGTNVIARANHIAASTVVKAQEESPAIKAMEAGSQEAYRFMTEGVRKQQAEEAKKEERAKRIEKNGEKMVKALNEAVEVFKTNGWDIFG